MRWKVAQGQRSVTADASIKGLTFDAAVVQVSGRWICEVRNRGCTKEEFSFPRLIVVPLVSQEIDGVRKEKERLTNPQVSTVGPTLPSSYPSQQLGQRIIPHQQLVGKGLQQDLRVSYRWSWD